MPSIQFKGKSFVQNYHLTVPYHQLAPQADRSLTDKVSLHDNLILQGDNLLALKALLPTHAGKVKCVYIDPPYNTGNEGWVYNDNVKSPIIKDWIGKAVGKEGEDFTRHDKWLCMIMPRLKLLRELLSEDGVIFVSIDDNEQHNLRLLMDEVFGEVNFVSNIIWQKKYTQSNDAKYFSSTHDFIICYAKSISQFNLGSIPRTTAQNERYTNVDSDPNGPWISQPLHAKSGNDKSYEFKFKNGVTWSPPAGTFPRYSKQTLEAADANGKIWFGSKGTAVPRLKKYLSEMKEGVTPKTIWTHDEVGNNDGARQTIKDIFEDNIFDTPKPVTLIKRILELSTQKDSLVLDSFAGSGTTAQAVLELNKQDGGNRKFILVEMEDYADSITAERVRRVIKGVPSTKNELIKSGLAGTFSYFQLGEPIEIEGLLDGTKLPSYLELARYVYYTATGEEFDESNLNELSNFVGSSSTYDIYMLYKPDLEYLKQTALTLNMARELRDQSNNRRVLVFAPTKYIETSELDELRVDFSQLPFEIYKVK